MTDFDTTLCPACRVRTKDWKGDDPRCAFPDGSFNADNWQCATLNRLRQEAGVHATAQHCGDQSCVALPFSDCGEFLVLTWYKNRGTTEGCFVLDGAKTRKAMLGDVRDALATLRYDTNSAEEQEAAQREWREQRTKSFQDAFDACEPNPEARGAFHGVLEILSENERTLERFKTTTTRAVDVSNHASQEVVRLTAALDHIHNTVGACTLGHPDPCDEGNCNAQVVVTEVHNTTMAYGWPE